MDLVALYIVVFGTSAELSWSVSTTETHVSSWVFSIEETANFKNQQNGKKGKNFL